MMQMKPDRDGTRSQDPHETSSMRLDKPIEKGRYAREHQERRMPHMFETYQ